MPHRLIITDSDVLGALLRGRTAVGVSCRGVLQCWDTFKDGFVFEAAVPEFVMVPGRDSTANVRCTGAATAWRLTLQVCV